MTEIDPALEFGKRVRVARVWAGYNRQSEFGAALAERWPDWPVRTNVKRVELGERTLNYEEIRMWASRVAEFTGVPEWFMLAGWDGGVQEDSLQSQLDELREAVKRHDLEILQAIRDRPAPTLEDGTPIEGRGFGPAPTTLRRAARAARQKQDERPASKPKARRDQQG